MNSSLGFKTNTARRVLGLAALAAIPGTANAQALTPEEEIEVLRKEVAALRGLVEELVAEREQAPSNAAPPPPPAVTQDAPIKASPEAEAPVIIANKQGDDLDDTPRRTSIFSSRQPLGRIPDDAFLTRGDFTGSIKIPDTELAFRIGGNLIVNANYDFDNLGFQQIVTQPTIPLDGNVDDGTGQFAIHPRFSRVNFDFRGDTPLGEIRTFLEIGFFGTGGEFVNDYGAHVRHAAVEVGNVKIGQFWSGFMDVFAQPETADPGTPLGLPSKRQPGLYWVSDDRDGSNIGFGIENPVADLGGRVDLIRSEEMPDLVAFAKLQKDWGYVRLAGMARQLRSQQDSDIVGGLHLSGRLNTPWLHERDNLAFGVQYGEGFMHYYSSFVGGLDGVILDNGEVEATGILGGFAAYQHWWSDQFRSTVNVSFFDLDLPGALPPKSYSEGRQASLNLVWSPILGTAFGAELNYQEIETLDGSFGEGLRLDLVSRFDF